MLRLDSNRARLALPCAHQMTLHVTFNPIKHFLPSLHARGKQFLDSVRDSDLYRAARHLAKTLIPGGVDQILSMVEGAFSM